MITLHNRYDSGRLPEVKAATPPYITSEGWKDLEDPEDVEEEEGEGSPGRHWRMHRRRVTLKTFRDAALRITTSKKISSDMMVLDSN